MSGFDVDKLMRWIEPIRSANIEPMVMNTQTRQRLYDVYKADMKNLSDLLQTDLTMWLPSNFPATGTG
jgi:hypothetical protein